MAKLMEKNGAEMCAALVSIADPIRHYLDDAEFQTKFKECTKKGVSNKLQGFLTIYADMIPMLFGEKHLKDTMAILAAIEGKSVSELLKMNGVELMKDAFKAWNEQIQPFFTQLGLSV